MTVTIKLPEGWELTQNNFDPEKLDPLDYFNRGVSIFEASKNGHVVKCTTCKALPKNDIYFCGAMYLPDGVPHGLGLWQATDIIEMFEQFVDMVERAHIQLDAVRQQQQIYPSTGIERSDKNILRDITRGKR